MACLLSETHCLGPLHRRSCWGMSGPSERPWLASLEALDAISADGGGRVVVTDPDQAGGVDLGQVLRWALAGRTHTFAAIVGYFAHRGAKSDGGSKPELRFRFIQERAAFAKDLDI